MAQLRAKIVEGTPIVHVARDLRLDRPTCTAVFPRPMIRRRDVGMRSRYYRRARRPIIGIRSCVSSRTAWPKSGSDGASGGKGTALARRPASRR
jgi:hypothetical protein